MALRPVRPACTFWAVMWTWPRLLLPCKTLQYLLSTTPAPASSTQASTTKASTTKAKEGSLSMTSSEPFRVLTVCTGNICRSPLAERVLQAGFDALHPGVFEVTSAGTGAIVDHSMQPEAAELVQKYGGDSDGFVSRQITPEIARAADLVLVMTTEHRSQVIQLSPALLKRTFTVREFARMLDALAPRRANLPIEDTVAGQWRQLPALAASVRHLCLPETPEDNDVSDPFRRGQKAWVKMDGELSPALRKIFRYARHITKDPAAN
ncbi:low molecular weight phosphatase family protein [Pseudarthrobacter sp. J1738]|uniref:arsenate reductase/protein-tyrosine-phosphatase family protein n=1 Tax=Pseudarthrobacter sp. J1738 TaxID=3420446 RepID=UPI003D2663C3